MDITAAWSCEGDSTGLEQEDRRQHKELHKLCNPLNARCLIRAGLPCHTTAPDTRWVHPCCNVWRLQRTSIPPPPPAWPLLLQTEGFCSQPDGAGGDLAGIAVLQVLHESEGPFPTTVKNTVILRSPTSYKRCNTSYTEVPNMCLTASLATITGIRHCSALSATWTLPQYLQQHYEEHQTLHSDFCSVLLEVMKMVLSLVPLCFIWQKTSLFIPNLATTTVVGFSVFVPHLSQFDHLVQFWWVL